MFRRPYRPGLRRSTVVAQLLVLVALVGSALPAALARPAAATAPGAAQVSPTRVYLPFVSTGTPPAPPTAQDVIAQALAAGRIDLGTALLYRAYALFRDDRLPPAFWGAGSSGEDNALFTAIADHAAELSPALQAQLRQFVVRPDDPESVFNQPRGAAVAAAAEPAPIPCVAGWAAFTSPTVPVKLWACKTGDYAAALQAAASVITPIYQAEVELMGDPIADAGGSKAGGSNHIDLYLLDPLQPADRGGDPIIPGTAAAAAIPAPPYSLGAGQHTSSGFMLLARERLDQPGFRNDFAHELFHVLQNRYNYKLQARAGGAFWWAEATAEWAAAHFVRDTAAGDVYQPRFVNMFRTVDLSLHAELPIAYPYAAFIWPFFMEQEAGAQGIARTWQVLANVAPDDWNGALDVIDTELPFAQNFHQFAIRNLNSSFGGDNPLPRRYQQLDPNFPAEVRPKPNTPKLEEILSPQSDGAPVSYPEKLPALRAHYYTFRFADDVRQVDFDFRSLAPAASRTIGAVVKVAGRPWKLIPDVGDYLHFCFDDPEQDVEEIWFVVSNHAKAPGGVVEGAIEARPRADACACDSSMAGRLSETTEWRGAAALSYDVSASTNTSGGQETVHVARSEAIQYGVTDRLPMVDGKVRWQGGITGGTAVVADRITQQNGGSTYVETLAASGMPETAYTHLIRLELDPQLCTYDVWVAVYVDATRTYPGGSGQELAYQEFRVYDVPLSANPQTGELAGQLTVKATLRSDAHAARQNHLRVNSNAMAVLERIQGANNLGNPTVTWSFTPVALPR